MGVPLSTIWTQYFPPAATLTEKNLPSQQGKVVIITGGNSGVGYELCQILYHAGAKVYMAARNEKLAQAAIERIRQTQPPTSSHKPGELIFVKLDVSDLDSVKSAAEQFRSKEAHLHVLFNNAGATVLPTGSRSKQDHELTLATNCLGAFLLTHLLLPELSAAAKTAPAASVRVIWTSSILTEMSAPKHGLDLATINTCPLDSTNAKTEQYAATKAGNYFYATEFARRYTPSTGIVSLTQNPGNLKTNVWRNAPTWIYALVSWTLYDGIYGARTGLWAGWSEGVGIEHSGGYVVPWGRWHPGQRADLVKAVRGKDEGGLGRAEQFWEWSEEVCKGHL